MTSYFAAVPNIPEQKLLNLKVAAPCVLYKSKIEALFAAHYFKLGRSLGFTPSDSSPNDDRLASAKVARTLEKPMAILEVRLGPEIQEAFASGKLSPSGKVLHLNVPMVVQGDSSRSVQLLGHPMIKDIYLHCEQVFSTDDKVAPQPEEVPPNHLMMFWLVLKATASQDAIPGQSDVHEGLFRYLQKNTKPAARKEEDGAGTTWVLFTTPVSSLLAYHAQQKATKENHDAEQCEVLLYKFGLSLQSLLEPDEGITTSNMPFESSLFGDYWSIRGEDSKLAAFLSKAALETEYKGKVIRAGLSVIPADRRFSEPLDVRAQDRLEDLDDTINMYSERRQKLADSE
ncbi:unnamed protein product [Symbiodinium sp. CCMP2592]|nr:unnamed protein product [Symbiodinium sp. CCMP2592]